MTISKEWQKVLVAYEAGFRITKEGEILSHTGNLISGYVKDFAPGYFLRYFSVRFENKPTCAAVHKLQAYQKFGADVLEEGIVVRHRDGNSLNNSFNNILIGTMSDNMMDRCEVDRVSYALIAAKSNRKLSEQQVRSLREDRELGFTYKQLMNKYNIAKSTISYIVNNKTYKPA